MISSRLTLFSLIRKDRKIHTCADTQTDRQRKREREREKTKRKEKKQIDADENMTFSWKLTEKEEEEEKEASNFQNVDKVKEEEKTDRYAILWRIISIVIWTFGTSITLWIDIVRMIRCLSRTCGFLTFFIQFSFFCTTILKPNFDLKKNKSIDRSFRCTRKEKCKFYLSFTEF